MKKILISVLLLGALSAPLFAAKSPSVEVRGDFVKITEGDKPAGAPVDRDAPDILYVRRDSIIRASVFFATRTTEFKVIVVTAGPASPARFDEERYTVMSESKSYFYSFPNEAAAVAFCETLIGGRN